MVRTLSILALVLLAVAVTPGQRARAAEAQPCDRVDVSTQQEWMIVYIVSVNMNAGDQFTYRTTTVSGEPLGQMWLEVNYTEVGRRDLPGELTWIAPDSGVYDIAWRTVAPIGYFYRADAFCEPASLETESDGDSGPVIGPPCENVFDSRINNSLSHDCAAPVAVYMGSIDVYGIHPDTGEGVFLLRVEDEAMAGDAPAENTLLAEAVNPTTGQPVRVYRLTSDEIYLATAYADGKPYIIVWQNGNPDTIYHVAA